MKSLYVPPASPDAMTDEFLPYQDDATERLMSASAMSIDEIWRALVNDQLVPYFQPVVELRSRKVLGVEALARWRHPALGVLSPVTFVPIMEERGMIRELTELILEKSLYACRDWLDHGRKLTVSINLSALSLTDHNLPGLLESKCRIAGLPSSSLILELSENTLRQHWELAEPQLGQLRERGFGVAVDEYGIGSGLATRLNGEHFSTMKIDRAFVHGAGSNPHLRAILQENLLLAQRHRLFTVAMGIEESADLALLSELGCDAVQGYLCSAPLPAEGLLPWIYQWEKG